jgi:uncharacterized membrane protein YhdT
MNAPRWYIDLSEGRRAFALSLLGLETWVLVAVLPRLEHGLGPGWLDGAAALLPLGMLAVGVTPAPRIARSARATALILGFPLALAASIAARPDLVERDALGPVAVGLVVLSLAAFLALSLSVVGTPESLRPSSSQPLPPEVHQKPSGPFRFGRLVLGLAAVGSLGLLALSFWGGRADVALRFGEAADDVGALSVVLAGLLSAVAIGAVIGPGLRARKRTDARREQLHPRLWPYLVIAGVALLLRGALYLLDTR